jgi:plasmid stabilization system protein ParE
LWDCFQRIAESPDIGHAVPEFTTLRAVRVSSRFWRYFVFYRSPDTETIEAVRVLHGARDLTALLRDIV